MSKFYQPKIVILFFILLVFIVPFYESNRVIMWETQRETQKENIFQQLVLGYAKKSEEFKKNFGLGNFFEKENSFWKNLKESFLFSKPITIKETGQEIIIPTEKEETKETDKVEIDKEKVKINDNKKEKSIPLSVIYSYYRFLIIGDSFIAVYGGTGEILERELLKYKDVSVKRLGQVSSGLSRPDYFNWETKTIELISQYHPNIAIIMLSSNDAQSITTPQGIPIAYYGSKNWNQEYSKRVSNLLDIFEENKIMVFWIGFPIMKNKVFSNKIKNLNSIYEKEIQKRENAYFFSTWELLADVNGNYLAYLPDEQGIYRATRQADGVHLTYFAGNLVVRKFIEKMEGIIKLEPKVKIEP